MRRIKCIARTSSHRCSDSKSTNHFVLSLTARRVCGGGSFLHNFGMDIRPNWRSYDLL